MNGKILNECFVLVKVAYKNTMKKDLTQQNENFFLMVEN